MSNFKFRLQKLLDVRKENEKKSIIKFKNAQNEKIKTQKKLEKLKKDYDENRAFKKDETTIERKIKLQFLYCLEGIIEDTKTELIKKENAINICREELKTKQVERKTVEILKEKQKVEFLSELNSKEQKTNDELALYAYMRNAKDA